MSIMCRRKGLIVGNDQEGDDSVITANVSETCSLKGLAAFPSKYLNYPHLNSYSFIFIEMIYLINFFEYSHFW